MAWSFTWFVGPLLALQVSSSVIYIYLIDKFDQFWSVNRKLMEHTSEDGFRHIPFRLYVPESTSKPYIQFLVKPVENEKKSTVEDLLQRANLKFDTKGRSGKQGDGNSVYFRWLYFLSCWRSFSSHHTRDRHPPWDAASVVERTPELSWQFPSSLHPLSSDVIPGISIDL